MQVNITHNDTHPDKQEESSQTSNLNSGKRHLYPMRSLSYICAAIITSIIVCLWIC